MFSAGDHAGASKAAEDATRRGPSNWTAWVALAEARRQPHTSVVVVETAFDQRVPGYESWWDVPIAEVSESESVKAARRRYDQARKKERYFF